MEKKKLKLSISGASKKTINSIEQAKSQSKNAVVIEKRAPRYTNKTNFSRGAKSTDGRSQRCLRKHFFMVFRSVGSGPKSVRSGAEIRDWIGLGTDLGRDQSG